ncbi:Hypothetical protein HVIM_03971 [Roseomonas mucosa]|uniref:Uncharacterized protein n=1 Tax=Roseomonas mucosa TaxID=207340 RepID=A0A4Y1MTB0_9PROT|nr:Hypothetical protein RADP37_03971 [Roseomonas mucosa]QDD92966.1 Hypothetical protein HVIM_03971 [Roseomonas mucosa]QDD98068.1 Hypothetical protein ADP8_03971 [Roseomonas mucosa]UZO90261.1 Hypothetical protein RMP42_03971 [Roseomonas mucosa]
MKGAAFPPDPLSARTLRALDPVRWRSLMPDRAGEHGSPADCRCRPCGNGVFLFGSPAFPPAPGDQAAG